LGEKETKKKNKKHVKRQKKLRGQDVGGKKKGKPGLGGNRKNVKKPASGLKGRPRKKKKNIRRFRARKGSQKRREGPSTQAGRGRFFTKKNKMKT